MPFTFDLNIVSAEESIFAGKAIAIVVRGAMGDIGISYGHTPLLTSLRPGTIKVTDNEDNVEFYYVSGGLLEVQPYMTTILADTVERAINLDESAALAAKKAAEEILSHQEKSTDFAKADLQLLKAVAQLKTLNALRNRAGK